MSPPDVSPDPSAEQALVARIRSGDGDAFRAIWDTYHARLTHFVKRYVRSDDLAADVTQQVFYVLWRDRATWSPNAGIAAWLYRAARHRTLDALRGERTRAAREVDLAERVDVPAVPNDGPLTLEARETAAFVQRILATLPPRTREVFIMNRVDGLAPGQIAEVLGIRPQVVYNQLSRAVRALADGLEAFGRG